MNSQTVADAPKSNWLDRFAPEWLKPYGRLARWDRPIGWWLLLWPCWFALALAGIASGQGRFEFGYAVLFLIGAVAMRGAGCTFNDLVDQDFDAQVERTRSRPLPAGQVSRRQAWAFLFIQALAGLAVLLCFNWTTIYTGLASLGVVAIYPFMKRITYIPQLFLGFAFSWGALVGWTAVMDQLSLPALLLYVGCILWTIGYDTFYAHQDKEDDILIGVKSTALWFQGNTKPIVRGLYTACLIFFGIVLAIIQAPILAWMGLAGFALLLFRQVTQANLADPDSCLAAFKANHPAAALLTASWLAAIYLAGHLG